MADQQDVSYKSYARIPNLVLYGLPNLAMQEKWVLASLVGMCLNRQKDGRPPLKELEGPYKLSLRDIEKISGVSYSVLRTYGKQAERVGVLDRLQSIGYVTVIDAYPLDAMGNPTKRAQTYLYVHLEKIWLDNVGSPAPTGTLVSTDSFVIVSNTNNVDSQEVVNVANNIVSNTNGIVSNTDNIVSVTNNHVSNTNNVNSHKPALQQASRGVPTLPNTDNTITNTVKNNKNTVKSSSSQKPQKQEEENTQPPLLDAPLVEPHMNGRWDAEMVVQYTEFRNGNRYAPKLREAQLSAAKWLHSQDKALTSEQYKLAFDERFDPWWIEHKKKLDVTDMKAKEQSSGVIRLYAMLGKIEANKNKPNLRIVASQQGARPTALVSEVQEAKNKARMFSKGAQIQRDKGNEQEAQRLEGIAQGYLDKINQLSQVQAM